MDDDKKWLMFDYKSSKPSYSILSQLSSGEQHRESTDNKICTYNSSQLQ